ncbi:MAG: glutamine-hydrolyzing GMP synthase [Candidatus Auribacterota bacterium]|jgi:GMP synthase (glutamine-hydrolysing)|nr:glutamine-hydrolyzing GMP synthase [Candidatus Auribacterota bacterium]
MDTIYVIDFGGQYAHLIANRIRRLNVYAQIKHPDVDVAELENARGIILSGGPKSVYDKDCPVFNADLLKMNVPILGLCFGHQLLVHLMGGIVEQGFKEYGSAHMRIRSKEDIFKNLADSELVWMSHGDSVKKLPDHFKIIGSTEDCPFAAIHYPGRDIFGFQFHPEVSHTTHGMTMLANFLDICSCRRSWTIKNFISSINDTVKEQVGDRKVFMLVSGGVDSTVAFTLLNQILGEDRVQGLTIDTGFCRKEEMAEIRELMRSHKLHNLLIQDHSDTFLQNLKGVFEPEKKRKIIGKTFIDVADKALRQLKLNPNEWLLGQGTIYPDTIESGGTKNAAVIKTHHNRVDIVADLVARGLVVEPLAQLYKDEVRELGIELGLPERMVWRHPFPGPGLAVRTLCSTGEEEEIVPIGYQTKSFCQEHGFGVAVLPIRSVGVQGDVRSYAHPAVLYGKQDWTLLEKMSTYLTNKHQSVNRVLTLLAPSEMPSLRLKKAFLTRDRLDLLREADDIVMRFIEQKNLDRIIWQMPTVILPLTSDGKKECIVLRPVITRDFMTARFAEIPFSDLSVLTQKIMDLGGIDAVFYDITHKPPGTIEWE